MGRQAPKKVPKRPVHTGVVIAVYDTDIDAWFYYDDINNIPIGYANGDALLFTLDGVKTLRIGRRLED